MNIIWTTIVVVCALALTASNASQLLPLFTQSATQALDYTFTLIAVYSLWLGVFSLAERCLLVEKLSNVLCKVNNFLYGNVSQVANNYLSLNMASNILGVGNASTPSAIEAIKNMERGVSLSRAGAMLFVLNANGLQLVPTTVVSLRASLGSANATDILLPTVICTVTTALLGVLLVSFVYGKKE